MFCYGDYIGRIHLTVENIDFNVKIIKFENIKIKILGVSQSSPVMHIKVYCVHA